MLTVLAVENLAKTLLRLFLERQHFREKLRPDCSRRVLIKITVPQRKNVVRGHVSDIGEG